MRVVDEEEEDDAAGLLVHVGRGARLALEHGRLVVRANRGARLEGVSRVARERAVGELRDGTHDVGDGDEEVAPGEEDDGPLRVVEAASVDEVRGHGEEGEEETRDGEDEDEGGSRGIGPGGAEVVRIPRARDGTAAHTSERVL